MFTQCVSAKIKTVYLDGLLSWKWNPEKKPEVNTRLKWISYCFSFDYANNKASLFIGRSICRCLISNHLF